MKKITILIASLFFALQVQAQENYTWGNVAMGGGGFVTGIITNPSEQGLMYARTDVGGAYRWDATNSKWIPLLDWVSEADRGLLGVESLATDPQQPNVVYLLAGTSYFSGGKSAFLKSTDYGATFTSLDVTSQFSIHGNGMGRENGEKLMVDPNNSNIIYLGSRNQGLFTSTDAGLTWTHNTSLPVTTTPNENGICMVVPVASSVSGGSTQTWFVGVSQTGSNFYKTTDGGATFTAVTGGPTDMMPQRASMASDGNLYITYANGAGPFGHWALPEPFDNGQVWKYNVAGNTWTNITPSGESAHPYGGINVDKNNPQRIILSSDNTWVEQENAYGDKMYLSNDGGTTWTDLIAQGFDLDTNGVSWIGDQSIHWAGSIEFDPFDSNKVWVVSGNGVFQTEDVNAAPVVWKFQVNGLEETVPNDLVSIAGGPTVSVISDYDGFRHTDVAQYSPILEPRMGTNTGLDAAAQNTNRLVRVGNKVQYSNDMGVTWTDAAVTNGTNGQVAISADGNVILHCPDTSSITYRTTDNGATWTEVTGLSLLNVKPAADAVNPSKFYVYDPSAGSLLVSTDAGVSFAAAGTTTTGGGKLIRTIPGKEGHLWIPLNGGGLARSTDGGATFTTLSTVTACASVGFGKAFTQDGYPSIFIWGTVNGVQGIFRSTDEGASWYRTNDDAHQYGGPGNGEFVMGDMNVYGRVYMSTVGRGVVYGETDATGEVVLVTGIEITPDGATLIQDQTVDLNTTITPANASTQSVTWTSTDAAIASVDAEGIVTGNATGTATVRATATDGSEIYDEVTIIVKGDADRDGVLDENDLCPETPAGDVVDVNGCSVFSLPSTNFEVTISAESCRASNNGMIGISAGEQHNYTAVLTGISGSSAKNFTTSGLFDNLEAGNYSVCITVEGQPDYQYCFNAVVNQPEELSVFVGRPANNSVRLDLSGSTYYTITVNGDVFSTNSSTYDAALKNGSNVITVKGDLECKGTVTQQVMMENSFTTYPNPATGNELYITTPNNKEAFSAVLYSISGTQVATWNIAAGSNVNPVSIAGLQQGTYILTVTSASDSKTFKIIR
jgi:hypothetical protein